MRHPSVLGIVALALAGVALAPHGALAQPAPKPPVEAAAPEPPPAPPPAPKPIEVSDAWLAPVPPAPHTLGSWKEAATLTSARSAELTVALQEVRRAEGLSRQAVGAALPTVDVTGRLGYLITGTQERQIEVNTPTGIQTYSESGRIPSQPSAGAALTITQPVLAPRVWHGIGTSRLAIDATRYNLEDARRVVLAAVASNVVAVVTAERVSEINRVGLRSALERLELTQRRQRLGTGTKLDVVRAEQDVALARATIVSGDEAVRQTREALGLALGTTDEYGVPPSISLNAIEQDLRSMCAAGAPERRADILAAQTEARIAERNVTDAKLAFAPYAQVSSSLSADATDTSKSVTWSIQGLITIPIWDGSRYGTVQAARAVAEQQRARVDIAARGANLDTTQAVRAVAVAEQARAVAEQARDLANETARLTQVAFEAGTATSFDLVESGRRQREAELDLAVREFDLIKAKIAALLASASCRY